MDRGPLDMLVQIVHAGKTDAVLPEQPWPELTHHVTSENGWATTTTILQLAATLCTQTHLSYDMFVHVQGCPHRSRTHAFTHHANTRGSSTTRCRQKNSSSPTCHVSSFAALDTDFQHKLTLTHLTYLPIILSHTVRSTESRSVCSTAMIHGRSGGITKSTSPTGYEAKRRASSTGPYSTCQIRRSLIDLLKLNSKIYYQKESWEMITKNPINENTDEFGENWCQVAVLPPIADALRLRLSGKHCRLGP